MLGIHVCVRVSGYSYRVTVKVRARVRDSWGTKRMGTKRLVYEMSGSRYA